MTFLTAYPSYPLNPSAATSIGAALANACRKVSGHTPKVCLQSFNECHRLLASLQGKLMELMSGGVTPAPAPTSYRHLLGVSSTEPDNFIVAIDKVTLAQNAASAGNDQQGPRWGCLALCWLFAIRAWPVQRQFACQNELAEQGLACRAAP